MKWKKYLVILLSLLYFDLIFNLFAYDSYLRESFINIVLYGLINSAFVFIMTSIWSDKVNKIITYVIYTFMALWYSLYYIFYRVLLTPFSIALFRQTDQVLDFAENVIISILQNSRVILLFFIPLILFIVFRKRIFKKRLVVKEIFVSLCILFVSIGLYGLNIFVQEKDTGSIYNLYFETNNVSLNIERLGVMAATLLDVHRSIFGFDEKIKEVKLEEENNDEELFEYDYNNLDLNLDGESGNIKTINNYIKSESGTKKNQYTGMFEGMNLIFVVAESFSEIAVSEKLTPTLYKLIHEGFYFKNYYTSNNLSTIG